MAPSITMSVRVLSFNDKKVVRRMNAATRKALQGAGAAVRRDAKKSLTASANRGRIPEREVQPESLRERRRVVNRIRRSKGQPRLKPLRRPSRPGEPPAAGPKSPLNRLLLFGFDPRSESVVVGPAKLSGGGDVPLLLEEGGSTKIGDRRVRIAARPYMGPALRRELPNLPVRWANSVKGG